MHARSTLSAESIALSEEFKLCRPDELPEAEEVYAEIARRAYALFESRQYELGHDWEDWFRAESELLRPVPVEIKEKPDKISVRATVLGFDAAELKACVEPLRLIIFGKKRQVPERGEKIFYVDWVPDEIFQPVYLPAPVVPERATAKLHAGVLELTLPRKGRGTKRTP
jgi:HSP20 family molecular chaperone IbpA